MFAFPDQTPTASIAQLKEIPLPQPPVSWMPQAAGWYVLAAMVVLALLAYAFIRWRRWRRNRYRREAQAELGALEQRIADPARRELALESLPALVKRTVLAWAPRASVASLTGHAWLDYLDRTLAGKPFTQGPGKHLEDLAYGGEIARDELTALMALLHHWIDDHVAA